MTHAQEKAAEVLTRGGIVIYPTDTAFGIGCRMDDSRAVERLFSVRRRSSHKATPVLVSSIEMAKQWVDSISESARALMDTYWPGGLTIVLPCKRDTIAPLVKGGTDTLGVRMPNHSDLLSVIESVGVPIIGSSANFEGENTPFAIKDVDPELVALVDYVMEGTTLQSQSSTVVDCTTDPYVILREGAVDLKVASSK